MVVIAKCAACRVGNHHKCIGIVETWKHGSSLQIYCNCRYLHNHEEAKVNV